MSNTYETTDLERKARWAFTNDAGHVLISNSMISYHWAGAALTNAPDPTDFPNYQIGINADGASTGNVYHTIDGAWVDTGATVAQLYGG